MLTLYDEKLRTWWQKLVNCALLDLRDANMQIFVDDECTKYEIKSFIVLARLYAEVCNELAGPIGVARGGPRRPAPPPIKIPPMIKNYDNIA